MSSAVPRSGAQRTGLIRASKAAVLLTLVTATCLAGSIQGTVRALPPRDDAEKSAAAGAYASRRYKYVDKIDYTQLRDFVVYIDQPMSEVLPPELAGQTVKT